MTLLDVTSGTWTITVIGWGIVFLALVILVIIFTNVPKIHFYMTNRRLRRQGKMENDKPATIGHVTGEESAAIAMALYMYNNERHDEESGIITIKRIERRYSPWSSKIYSLNNRNF